MCVDFCIENNDTGHAGTSWATVESPSLDVGAIHVATGVNVVWAVTKDHKVRKYFFLYCMQLQYMFACKKVFLNLYMLSY